MIYIQISNIGNSFSNYGVSKKFVNDNLAPSLSQNEPNC